MKVSVYSTSTCPYCVMLKRWLDDKKITYTDYRVDEDGAAARRMIQISGQMGVPFSTVEYDDGRIAGILGFDVAGMEQALRGAPAAS